MVDTEAMGAINEDSISSAISKLMEHPEIIGAVASALSGTASGESDEAPQATLQNATNDSKKDTDGGSELSASLMPIISRLGSLGIGGSKDGGGGGVKGGKHAALLCALKPYLSKNRSDAIDYMLKISQMSDIISKLR